MRQFVLAKEFVNAFPTGAGKLAILSFNDLAASSPGSTYLNAAPAADKNLFQILVGGDGNRVAPQTIPLCRNNFTYSKSVYQAGVNKKITVTLEAISAVDYARTFTLIVAIKGLKFNERNKWSADFYVPANKSLTVAQILKKLSDELKKALEAVDIKVTTTSSAIVFEGIKYNDFDVLGAEEWMGAKAHDAEDDAETEVPGIAIVNTTPLTVPQNDAKMVGDLADKAAADAGVQGTYREASEYMHPTFPFNPLKSDDANDTGFTVYTLRFTEPRAMATITTAVNQIVQIAVPNSGTTTTALCTKLDAIFDALAGTTAVSGVADSKNNSAN